MNDFIDIFFYYPAILLLSYHLVLKKKRFRQMLNVLFCADFVFLIFFLSVSIGYISVDFLNSARGLGYTDPVALEIYISHFVTIM